MHQSGKAKAVTPNLASRFEDDMIVLEKWKPKKPLSAIHFDGEKERYYVKRFVIESVDKEESFISDHPKSKLLIMATDFRPMAEVVFSKRSLENIQVNFEDFIAVKGYKAIGNQLTKEKIKQVNLLDPLPYEEPEELTSEEIEVVEEEIVSEEKPTEIEDTLPLEITNIDEITIKKPELSKEDKAKKALQKTIEKKKAKDDENQTSLF